MLADALSKNKKCNLKEFSSSRNRLEDSIADLGKVFV
jgi:hypothetical protein